MRRPVFVFSSGRCGSTLLQRLLNTYPEVTIWGEHAGALAPLAESYYQLVENRLSRDFPPPVRPAGESLEQLAERKDPRRWQPWLNFVSQDDIEGSFRRHVESFFRHPAMTDDHVWGFKEIRYGRQDRVIEFLHRLFPEALFVFLCRNGLNTVASQFQAWHRPSSWGRLVPTRALVAACREWRLQYETFRRWHDGGELDSYWITFEDLVTGGEVLRPLLDRMGLRFGPAQQQVIELVEGRGSAFESDDAIDQRWKQLGFLPLAAVEAIVGDLNRELGYSARSPLRWLRRPDEPRESKNAKSEIRGKKLGTAG
jgi:hypothetical protein